ncbi:MAG TPA: hypothetical protein VNU71_13420 [Burkholderiaceae bacterium]|nr:hypothetical protein [Burkholderiaceae bacterium]
MRPAATLAKEQARAKREGLELALDHQLRALGLTVGLTRQWKFHGTRAWRFDFAYPDPDYKLAIEVDGGTWSHGAHSRGAGIEKDCEKLAAAVILGWRVMRATTNQVKDGTAAFWIERALGERYARMIR